MNQIHVSFLAGVSSVSSLQQASELLAETEKHKIGNIPWRSFPYKPEVSFEIAHGADCFFLKYLVNEKNIRAVNSKINSEVYEDSCVEFFISFDNSGYYNLEFNCIGTNLTGFGKGRGNRERLPESILKKIRYASLINNDRESGFHWELTLIIPFEIFIHHPFSSLKNKQCRANFYKCGDLLPEPHYVTWSNIESPKPDFHLPEFFGSLSFK